MGLEESDPILTPLQIESDQPEKKPAEDLAAGARLGKYEILKRLSVGGMAEIFLARAAALPGFRKLVVVKRILPQLAAQPEFLDMFMDEARIAATLQHPNIVQTYDVAVAAGTYFIAMEFLHGEDLNMLLRTVKKRKERIPLEHALQIMISLCSGLHYAHEKEDFDGKPLAIVHRDVTPANVIVTYEGSVKLLDFGIARAATRAETRSGTLKGKIHYMSPEQAQGQPIDRRTDIYAAGIIFYELTLMRRLYRGGTDYQVLHEVVNGTIPTPRAIDPSYDPELEAIVMKALARDLDKRYKTAQEMQNDLEAYAKKRGLYLSPSSLKQYYTGLFGARIDAWKQAQAEGRAMPDASELVIEYEDDDEAPSAPVVVPGAAPDAAAPKRSKLPRAPLIAAGVIAAATVFASTAVLWPRHPPAPPPAAPVAAAPVAPVAPVEPAPLPAAPAPPTGTKAGRLSITTHPRGATLILDGRRLGRASNATLDVDSGEHTLVVEKHGFQSQERRIAVEPGTESKLTLELYRGSSTAPLAPAPAVVEPPPAAPMKGDGTLAITSSPWVAVEIDGADRGQTPLKLTVPAGSHKITLSNPEFGIKRQLTVLVHPGETVRKSMEFTR